MAETATTLTILCVTMAVFYILSGYHFFRRYRLLKQRLLTALKLEEEEKNGPASASSPAPDNQDFLRRRNPAEMNAPARYRYVSSLVNHGMDAAEIAEILEISSAEAEQLLRLSKVSGSTAKNR